jgi:tetratricopeptide (TPR) repeat protein
MLSKLRWYFVAGAVLSVIVTGPASAQGTSTEPEKPNRSAAYYHAALGHLYAELAAQYGGRGEYVKKAIDNYKLAMRHDPSTGTLAQKLADLYLQTGQIRSAVAEFEEAVRRNPDDVNSRRILARFYTARIRDGQQNRMNQEMLKSALEQYTKISEKAPQDLENWLMLGRLQKLAQNSSDAEKAYKKALEIDPENEDALTGLAMVYSGLGDNTSAAQMLKKVADKNPNLRTLAELAAAYEQMRDYKLAAEAYKKALELNKENTDLKRAYGQALFSADDLAAAQAVFEEILKEEPNDLLSNLRLSQIFLRKREYPKARDFALKARQLDPNNLEIRYNEVAILEAEGKTQEAIQTLKQILAGMPKRPDSVSERGNRVLLLERLGILYRYAEQTQQAVAAFREIADIDPDNAHRAAAQIVDALRAGKEYEAADKEATAALQKYPSDRIVKVMAANVHMDLGRFKEAETLLKSLLDGKNDRETWLSVAQVYERAKRFDDMAKAINNAEKLSRTDEEKEGVWFMRGAMYERQKKYDLAEAEFRKVLKQSPDSASALNYLGYMLADRNVRLNEALEMIQKAVEMEPNNSAYLDSLGWVYYRLNRLEEAEDYLRRSLERGSRDATVHDHLGDVFSSRGKLKEAISQWGVALREWHSASPSERDPEAVAKIQKKLEGAKIRLAKEAAAPRQEQ